MISLARPIVCVVTPARGPSDLLIDALTAAADAGADLIHVREPQLDDRTLLVLVRRIVDATRRSAARVLVNERVDIAVAAGAAGVHLREDSVPAPRVRAVVPAHFVVGRSVHSVEQARSAEDAGGCDYLVFGTVFPSASKPAGHRAAGVDALAGVCTAVGLPVIAIGGITVSQASQVARAGAAGIAAIRLFAEPTRVRQAVNDVRQQFDTRSDVI